MLIRTDPDCSGRHPCPPQQDGVLLRELGPGRFDVLDAVFDGLSPTSRHHRFHGPVPRLTPQVRERLAAVDGHAHIAVAAFADGTPIGIARLIAVGGGRSELAVEVVDAWQRRGIGTRLVRAVADLGRVAGHREVVADVLGENIAAQTLFAVVFPTVVFAEDGPEISLTADLTAGGGVAAWAA